MNHATMSVAQIRQSFLDFFQDKGHTVVPSSPLVPGNDPTLMFTNSGMVQFKDVFLGADKRSYVRAASVQACLRAGGKHNDLENVGYTARHHTFFEMLGNWSFGDYFKRDSIKWGWELLTQVYKLPPERLLATVYIDDDEAYDIWHKEIGLPAERIVRIGDNKGGKYKSDNFWMMADTGPCGPCSEIFYDHGPHIPGGPPGSPEEDGDRFIEIWNHVFMQFEMHEDGSLTKLPAPCVDTGMGLERLAAILQHVHSNYEIDLFGALIQAAARETGCTDLSNPSLKVIADHIRACSFLITDGVVPSNEGRGYVQRRIVRRAIRHGYKLGQKKPFFHKLVADLVVQMGDAYPQLKAQEQRITDILKQEEERFFETLGVGMGLLEYAFQQMEMPSTRLCEYLRSQKGEGWYYEGGRDGLGTFARLYSDSTGSGITQQQAFAAQNSAKVEIFYYQEAEGGFNYGNLNNDQTIDYTSFVAFDDLPDVTVLSGERAFILHDTYGFPLDLTQDVARERGITVDAAGFEAAMQKQKDTARAAGKFKMDKALDYSGDANQFVGYEHLSQTATVLALYVDGTPVEALQAGQEGVVVLDTTPFYAESGGQVGDEGVIQSTIGVFTVVDTQKIKADVFGHHGSLQRGSLKVGDAVKAQVDGEKRAATVRNHSATHLMHKALRAVLGEHVQQKGSLVTPERTRFDFAHTGAVKPEEIAQIETQVNAEILANTGTKAELMSMEDAQKTGAMMFFGEKYGEVVRVLSIGTTTELCGGTHVAATGDIGLFKIVSEGGIASGVRRIEAVTGLNALALMQSQEQQLSQAAQQLKSTPDQLNARLAQVLEHSKVQEKEITKLKSQMAAAKAATLIEQAQTVGQGAEAAKILVAQLDGLEANGLRETVSNLQTKLGNSVVVIASVNEGKIQIAAGVSKDLHSRIKAGEVVNHLATQVGGKGGGKPDFAMAGGSDVAALEAALLSSRNQLEKLLNEEG